jgi:hypothetical protein
VQWHSEPSSRLFVDQDVKPQAGDPPGSTTATGTYRVKNLRHTDLPISVHTRKAIVEFISGPGRHTRRASRRKRTMRFNLHGEGLLDGEVGGAAGGSPSSSAKKLSSAPVLPTR